MREFVIVGPAQSGKSTFGKYLAEALGTQSTDTSAILVQVEMERQLVLCDRYGVSNHLCQPDAVPLDGGKGVTEHQFDYRRGRPARKLLVALGDAFVKCLGSDFLARRCLEDGSVCVGVRRLQELQALRYSREGVEVIWISRPGFQVDEDDNLDIRPADCDGVVPNDGSLSDLRELAVSLASRAHSVRLNQGDTHGLPSR